MKVKSLSGRPVTVAELFAVIQIATQGNLGIYHDARIHAVRIFWRQTWAPQVIANGAVSAMLLRGSEADAVLVDGVIAMREINQRVVNP